MLEKTIKVIERCPPKLLGLPDEIKDRIFCNRNVKSVNELDYRITNLTNPSTLKDLDKAIDRLIQALLHNQTIVIIGDYDADGATSTALTYKSLKKLGFENVHYIIPDRVKHGYGLSPDLVKEAIRLYQVDLIITVDNGISSFQGVDYANHHQIDVLITDHHLAGDTVPQAYAIINPNQKDCQFPAKNLAGVGVAYYLMKVLCFYIQNNLEVISSTILLQKKFLDLNHGKLLQAEQNTISATPKSRIRKNNFLELYDPSFNPDIYLDLVAIGTIADLATLDYNNRILVEQGVRRIRSEDCCDGVKAILKVQKLQHPVFSCDDIGFKVAPLINAVGRMEHMGKGVECLLSDNLASAQKIALSMYYTNQDRSRHQAEDSASAFEQFQDKLASSDKVSICLYNPDWHQGIIGLNSSLIKDIFWRPTFVFAYEEEGIIKGSGRSINDLHIKDCLDLIATNHPDLILKFGGHSGAAGVTIREKDFDIFAEVLDSTVRQMVDPQCIGCETIYVDLDLPPQYLNIEFALEIARMGPWGKGFPEPIFKGIFKLISNRIVGKNRDTLILEIMDSNRQYHKAIKFKTNPEIIASLSAEMEIFYSMSINRYNGREELNLIIKHLRPVEYH